MSSQRGARTPQTTVTNPSAVKVCASVLLHPNLSAKMKGYSALQISGLERYVGFSPNARSQLLFPCFRFNQSKEFPLQTGYRGTSKRLGHQLAH